MKKLQLIFLFLTSIAYSQTEIPLKFNNLDDYYIAKSKNFTQWTNELKNYCSNNTQHQLADDEDQWTYVDVIFYFNFSNDYSRLTISGECVEVFVGEYNIEKVIPIQDISPLITGSYVTLINEQGSIHAYTRLGTFIFHPLKKITPQQRSLYDHKVKIDFLPPAKP